MIKSRYLYFTSLSFLVFASNSVQAVVIIDEFKTDLGTHSDATSVTLGPSTVKIGGADFNRTVTASYNPSVTCESGPTFAVSSLDTKVSLSLGGSSSFKEIGSSLICGSYTTSGTPLVLKYQYGDITSLNVSLLYKAASYSDFVNLSATPLVWSDIDGFGTPNVSPAKSTVVPFIFFPAITYQMAFSDGTHSGMVDGVYVLGGTQFDASTISETVNLAHIVSMNLMVKLTNDTPITFTVIPGKEGELDDVKLRSDMYTNITFIKAVPKS